MNLDGNLTETQGGQAWERLRNERKKRGINHRCLGRHKSPRARVIERGIEDKGEGISQQCPEVLTQELLRPMEPPE